MNRKQIFGIVLGIAFIAGGLLWILNISEVFTPSISLDGWWAFFVIIPCLLGLYTGPDRIGSLVGLSIGILLLLSARDIIAWEHFWQYALAVLVIGIGIKMIFFKGHCQCKVSDVKTISRVGKDVRSMEFSFGKQQLVYDGEKFEGVDVKVAFGAADIDLRKAIIEGDVELNVDVAFGGIRIFVPDNVTVKPVVNCSFGGMTDNRLDKSVKGSPVIFITGTAAFGGVEIR